MIQLVDEASHLLTVCSVFTDMTALLPPFTVELSQELSSGRLLVLPAAVFWIDCNTLYTLQVHKTA